jgi:hypothetical protein
MTTKDAHTASLLSNYQRLTEFYNHSVLIVIKISPVLFLYRDDLLIKQEVKKW